ncbi:MAG: cytochrome c [Planctomycetota bacterium]
MTFFMRSIPVVLAATVAAGGLTGCRGERTDKPPRQLFPDMDDQPRFKVQRQSDFFEDGRTMRPVVEGTVPWGRTPVDVESPKVADTSWAGEYRTQRARLLAEDDSVYRGETGAGGEETDPDRWIERIPIAIDRELIEVGRKNFNIYCATCHGYEGDGMGTVGQKWAGQIVANYHEEKYKDPSLFTGRDGYFFYVGRNGLYDAQGVLRMPPFKQALDEREMWGVVAYIRALQASRGVSIESDLVPAEERERLISENPGMSVPAETRPADSPATTSTDTAMGDNANGSAR